MVDISELQKASMLSGERMQLARGLELLNTSGVKVVGFIVGHPRGEGQPGPPVGLTIKADHFTQPPQMLDSIKQQAAARLTALDAELKQLGITVSEPEAKKKKA